MKDLQKLIIQLILLAIYYTLLLLQSKHVNPRSYSASLSECFILIYKLTHVSLINFSSETPCSRRRLNLKRSLCKADVVSASKLLDLGWRLLFACYGQGGWEVPQWGDGRYPNGVLGGWEVPQSRAVCEDGWVNVDACALMVTGGGVKCYRSLSEVRVP